MRPTPASSLRDELSRRDDRALATLLALRPDLAYPPPRDLAALAARATTTASLRKAVDNLNEAQLRLLEALTLATPAGATPTLSSIKSMGLDPHEWTQPLAQLRHQALLWGPEEDLRLPSDLPSVLGPYPAGLGRPAAQLDDDAAALAAVGARLRRTVLEAPTAAQQMLERLASGPPVGQVSDAFSPEENSAAAFLLDHHLVVPIGPTTVELPREMGVLLRREAGPLGRSRPQPPQLDELPANLTSGPGSVATQADNVLTQVEDLLNMLAETPAKPLRTGGVGTTVLRRLATSLGRSPKEIASLLETTYSAGLLGLSDDGFLPSRNFDSWRALPRAQRWTRLAQAWLLTTRDLSRLEEDTNTAARPAVLGNGLERTNLPWVRSQVLHWLIDSCGTSEDICDLARWLWPRKNLAECVATTIAEAQQWGLLVIASVKPGPPLTLTSYAAQLLADLERNVDDDPLGFERDDTAETVLSIHLPETTDQIVVQSDLSIMVTGTPSASLFTELELLADRDPKGANVTVWRLNEASIRRALDSGYDIDEVEKRLVERSDKPLPQPVRYLLTGVAKQHGGTRVGVASTYIRSDSPEELAQILADSRLSDLKLRQLAPTVLVTATARRTLMERLRATGRSPVAEDAAGEVLVDRRQARRAEHPEIPDTVQRKQTTTPAALLAIAEDARAGENT
ncbi:helicase-associated domain-containing protein [Natronoglycomyces albus]|uniref:Helicase-associated domain-containing protein n=1 Tax=Natronoglycomyces albus TaxID=2811108 RepID=A0A895XNX8_9ACTN|nr:helicase-associated domain-containing protein [Natronoglycomyces albus]QSB05472.1 helicase-associated domain-containing protein [Natronoglycomyces albus]